jgi:hypothetical protein
MLVNLDQNGEMKPRKWHNVEILDRLDAAIADGHRDTQRNLLIMSLGKIIEDAEQRASASARWTRRMNAVTLIVASAALLVSTAKLEGQLKVLVFSLAVLTFSFATVITFWYVPEKVRSILGAWRSRKNVPPPTLRSEPESKLEPVQEKAREVTGKDA